MRRLWQLVTGEARPRRVPAGQFVLRKGTAPRDVFFLRDGTVKMGDNDERGNEKILHLLRPPAVMPLAFFSGPGQPAHWSYAALTDSEVYVLPYERLQARMRDDSQLAVSLMNWFSLEVHELLVRLSSLEHTDVRGKILAALRFLLAYHSSPLPDGWSRVKFPVSHYLLASMTGVRRESVTMQLGRLQRERIVRTAGSATLDINGDALA